MAIGNVLRSRKIRQLDLPKFWVVDSKTSLADTIEIMQKNGVGAVLVSDQERLSGIFTERDVLCRVIADELSPAKVTLGEVMTTDVICVNPQTDINEAAAIMQQKKIRHLPVCTETGKIAGMISIGDLNAFHASNQEQTIHFLNDYIYGRV